MSGTSTTVRVAVRFAPGPGRTVAETVAWGGADAIVNADPAGNLRGRSGGWLFHCHILPHAARGMMSYVEVRANGGENP